MASLVVMASGTSLPTRDQVPELIIRASSGLSTGAAAKALAVSCPPTAISGARLSPMEVASSAYSFPIVVPGGTMAGIIEAGILSLRKISGLHIWVWASISWVTLAKVESTAFTPPNK